MDAAFGWLARLSAVSVVLMLVVLLWMLSSAAMPSIRAFGWSFLRDSDWRPNELEQPVQSPDGRIVMQTIPPRFGALPVIYGTAVSSALALGIALPLSLGAALFLVRVAPRLKIASPVSFLIEFLAAIPSIAYGIWALFVLAPITGRNLLCGGLILAVMILPIVTAVSRDVLAAVPRAQIEGSLALGATWWQSCRQMLRYGRSGLFGAAMLGLARAAGETMAVTMVIGNSNRIIPSLLAPAQTMASLLANEFAEASSSLHRAALIEVALILLVMSLLFNVVARYLVVGVEARTAAAA